MAAAAGGASTAVVAAAQPATRFSSELTLERLRALMAEFADARDWAQYHTPRNLALALTGECGELAEIFQWRGDAGAAPGLPGWSARDVEHVGEELSDVLLYTVRLADRCGIDLAAAALAKLRKNAAKYPAEQARGRSDKYTAYITAPAPQPGDAAAGSGAAASGEGSSSSSAGAGAAAPAPAATCARLATPPAVHGHGARAASSTAAAAAKPLQCPPHCEQCRADRFEGIVVSLGVALLTMAVPVGMIMLLK